MSTCYIGEIRLLPYFRGAPTGWQVCDGSLLSISDQEVLFQLLGTAYGGDGVNSFGVPDLRSRVPVHQGTGSNLTPRNMGDTAGQEMVPLSTTQLAPHAHFMLASTAPGTSTTPAGNVLAAVPSTVNDQFYATSPQPDDAVPFPASMLQPAGGGQGHLNTAPTLTLQYCIATDGIYPSRP